MNPKDYFLNPKNPGQKQYEALRAFYADGLKAKDAAKKFGFSIQYFKKLRFQFGQQLKHNQIHYFQIRKKGPKKSRIDNNIQQTMISLRKQNQSILDIKSILESQGHHLSLDTINKFLKREGFAPLLKRSRAEREECQIKLPAPVSQSLTLQDEQFTTERGAGPLIFLPILEHLGIIKAIQESGYPKTSMLSDLSSILSVLALKLLGKERLSHDQSWNFDRALGLFAGLNVLPKSTTISSYSYRVTREMNRAFLKQLSVIFKQEDESEYNLDFKTIPHWGDASVLEKNWDGARRGVLKSILALIVQNPNSRYISYTNAEMKHRSKNDAIIEFIDFWKDGHHQTPKMLIFDSKFTTYQNLSKMNQDNIKFITLRRRGKNIINLSSILHEKWQIVQVESVKNQKRKLRVCDIKCQLRGYQGEVRQIILTDHGREKPTFIITNDFDADIKTIVQKYARRWLVEQEIAEQVDFFHLNQASSSLVIKVDFDLTLSLLAHNLYRYLAQFLIGFEKCTVKTIYRHFIENGASVQIKNHTISVAFKKKTHLPTLLQIPFLKNYSQIPWLNATIHFTGASVS